MPFAPHCFVRKSVLCTRVCNIHVAIIFGRWDFAPDPDWGLILPFRGVPGGRVLCGQKREDRKMAPTFRHIPRSVILMHR